MCASAAARRAAGPRVKDLTTDSAVRTARRVRGRVTLFIAAAPQRGVGELIKTIYSTGLSSLSAMFVVMCGVAVCMLFGEGGVCDPRVFG